MRVDWSGGSEKGGGGKYTTCMGGTGQLGRVKGGDGGRGRQRALVFETCNGGATCTDALGPVEGGTEVGRRERQLGGPVFVWRGKRGCGVGSHTYNEGRTRRRDKLY